MPFLLLNNLNDINCGHVRKCVMRSIIFWTIYLQDLAQNYIDKLLVFQWVLIVLLLLQICFYFVMRETFNSTSRYLDNLLNIDNPYFEQMVGQIYPTELQLNKANSSGTEAPFLDLNLSITNGIVSSKIYGKRDDLILKSYISHFLMEMFLPLLPMVYIFLSLFVLLECVLMLMISTTETYF